MFSDIVVDECWLTFLMLTDALQNHYFLDHFCFSFDKQHKLLIFQSYCIMLVTVLEGEISTLITF